MTRTLLRLLLAAPFVLTAFAHAQPAPLSEDVITAVQIDAQGRQAVDDYASGWGQRLTSNVAADREAAKRSLLAPLQRDASSAFRIQYGSRLKAAMTRLAGGDEAQALFAAELTGRLATVDANEMVLGLLGDERAPVRYAAARAARLQLASIDNPPAALGDQHRDALVAGLAERVSQESDAVVLDGLLTAASEAVARQSAATDTILERLSTALTTNLQSGALDAEPVSGARAVLRLVAAAQQRFRDQNRFAEGVAMQGGLLAGSAMGYVLNTIENDEGVDSTGAVDALEQLVKAAHNLVFFAASSRGVRVQADDAIPEAFERWRDRGDARPLRREIEGWIGDGGVLTRAPFNATPSDFPSIG